MDAAAIAATVVEKNFMIIPLCCLNKRGESERLRVQSDRRRSQQTVFRTHFHVRRREKSNPATSAWVLAIRSFASFVVAYS